MTTTWCPDLSGDTAAALVGNAHDIFMERGTDTFNKALQYLTNLSTIALEPYNFDASFNYANPQATFIRPTKPTFDESALDFRDPGTTLPDAPTYAGSAMTIPEAPSWDDVTAPTLLFGNRPNAPVVAVPTEPANSADLVIPVKPDYVLPELPTFESLNLPGVPTITLPEWTAQRPDLTEPQFNQTWSFEPEAYTTVLVDTLVDTLKPMITAPQGLPLVIERALFERNRSRIEVEANRSVEQAYNDLGNRGFDTPQGVLFDTVRSVRQSAQDSLGEASRDVTIRQMELALEQQRFAITQGAALEGTLIQLYSVRQQYALEAAKFQQDAALAVLNYRMQVLQFRMQAYQTDAQIYRDHIQAELAKAEIYKAELDGQRLIGEINQQLLDRYRGQLQAVQTMADIYKTDVDVVRVQADIQMQAIEKYKAKIEAYTSRWQAYSAEVQGYASANNAELSKVEVYRAMVDVNAKRVDAWATEANVEVRKKELEANVYGTQLEAWKAYLQRTQSLLDVERSRLSAVAQSVNAKAQIYTAEASVESSASAAADRSFQLGLSAEQARVDTQLKVAEMKVKDAEFLAQQMVEIQRAIAQIAAQLASSTMSAVNYGASVSSSRSKSNSCSTNFSFTGETADA